MFGHDKYAADAARVNAAWLGEIEELRKAKAALDELREARAAERRAEERYDMAQNLDGFGANDVIAREQIAWQAARHARKLVEERLELEGLL